MKETWIRARQGFEGGTRVTKEFKEFARLFKKEFKKLIAKAGCSNLEMSVGHFYLSGFFDAPDGSIRYWSISDVRYFLLDYILIRYAKNRKDFSGGHNNYLKLDGSEEENICNIIENVCN